MSTKLPSIYQEFIHLSRYSRWLPEQKRRETWEETVARYFDFFEEHLRELLNYKLSKTTRTELEQAILNLEVMPSMRCLMTAGPALKRENLAGFNCSYIAIDSPRSFDEILYILMNGTGVGFSVERQFISNLPSIAENLYDTDTTIIVADSKIGWAKALKELVSMLFVGQIPKWDLSKVRPAGTPLKTFGGRASGPEPLNELFKFVVNIFKNANGRKLTSLECHDIVCKIAEIVVVGGVRRSALISLSNLSDERMRGAKSGQWWVENVQRALSNNSAAYTEKPDMGIFMAEWKALYDSRSGERGIFNRIAAKDQAKKYERRNPNFDFGTNPCGEIILRSKGLCNLSEVIVRPEDKEEDLLRKIRLATILGTFQSTLTSYKYVSKEWKINAEEESLLGVSLTGIMDCPLLNQNTESLPKLLEKMRLEVIKTNKEWAKKLDINESAASTTIKPAGTTSQLANTASGIHGRHAHYFIRTIRSDNKDPLCKLMKDMGFPYEADVTKAEHTTVFSFPVKSPGESVFRNDLTAIQQLELWLVYRNHYCEHNPSVTISVKEPEWMEVGAWVYKHFNEIGGVSFLPFSDHVYRQAPYQECTKEEYEKLLEKLPKNVDWTKLVDYENKDMTNAVQELSCVSGACEII